MTTLKEMYYRTTSCPEFNKMLRTTDHFSNYFGLNHFYYTRVLDTGEFTSIGTNCRWHEFVFDIPEMVFSCPIIKDFAAQQTGVIFLKNSSDHTLHTLMDEAYIKHDIHFTICINRKSHRGLESFGFGTNVHNLKAGEHLIKELPLVNKFIDYFLTENTKLIRIAHENQVHVTSTTKSNKFPMTDHSPTIKERKLLLKQLGLDVYETLTKREKEILRFVAQGFPAKFIADESFLSVRTVENYIATIKSKLHCTSKVELIKKAKDCHAFVCPEPEQQN